MLAHPGGEQLNTIHQRKVSERDEGTENDHRNQDNDRRVAQFGLRRPGSLFELCQRLLIEKTDTAEWVFHIKLKWQERRDSNPQLTVLETVALPIELLSCDFTENSV